MSYGTSPTKTPPPPSDELPTPTPTPDPAADQDDTDYGSGSPQAAQASAEESTQTDQAAEPNPAIPTRFGRASHWKRYGTRGLVSRGPGGGLVFRCAGLSRQPAQLLRWARCRFVHQFPKHVQRRTIRTPIQGVITLSRTPATRM